MKKVRKVNGISFKDALNNIQTNLYSKQTLISLFRALLETVIDLRHEAVILFQLNDEKDFVGLLNRLKYSNCKVFNYCETISSEQDAFTNVVLDNFISPKEEFLIIIADRFSAMLGWECLNNEGTIFEGFCSLNPTVSKEMVEHLQNFGFNLTLDEEVSKIRQDRRDNENFNSILNKLLKSLETSQQDLLCANTEINDINEKSSHLEFFAEIGKLCSTIAHEIRNPLGVIDLYTRIISKQMEKIDPNCIDSETVQSLNNASKAISTASKNMENLLYELIDYSKPIELKIKDSSLNEILDEVVNLLMPLFEQKQVVLNLKKIDDVVIKIDREKFIQVLINVLKNALEATESGKKVDIELIGNYLQISDEGAGISEENKNKIFKLFFTTKKSGSGIGLARSKKIMEMFGGDLLLLSTGESGSSFGIKVI